MFPLGTLSQPPNRELISHDYHHDEGHDHDHHRDLGGSKNVTNLTIGAKMVGKKYISSN